MSKANFEKHTFLSKLKKSKDELREPYISKGLLGTDDKISEILSGIVMILTFTCTFSVIKSDSASIMDMLTGAICSTIAWGLFDTVLYLYMTLIDKEHNLTFFRGSLL